MPPLLLPEPLTEQQFIGKHFLRLISICLMELGFFVKGAYKRQIERKDTRRRKED